MTADTASGGTGTTGTGWSAAVRGRLGLSRLLPLGGTEDGAWLAERAAVSVLRRAAGEVRGVAPGAMRVRLADPDAPRPSKFPAPPGAAGPGPLLIDGEFVASGDSPLPELAEELRTALFTTGEWLGLTIARVDLRVTGLGDAPPDPGAAPRPTGRTAPAAGAPPGKDVSDAVGAAAGAPLGKDVSDAVGAAAGVPLATAATDPVAAAVLAVDGVDALTTTLGPSVHRAPDHLRVELAVSAGHRPPTVVHAVRRAAETAQPRPLPVTVLITQVR
ncbi:hypothetical protein [Streptomyces purpureus]|uniref:Nucleopolyhedrovirus P10 family protein n=1 Tax=Streptomyces purpureus TaxID=1951 RepID=A0A918H084_9ACTN|nr:hypothetical protein [Streptomyces purpureus]GGT24870.1 hypothetical protein GCM10014713_17530 [Streptomyces purpureus]